MTGPDLAQLTQSLPWLRELASEARAELAAEVETLSLRGGDTLFREGDPADALYVVVSGCLGAFVGDGAGAKLLGPAVAGETVGELGLITGKPRNATVKALRDSELVRISRTSFERLAHRDPDTLLALARLALNRATAGPRTQKGSAGPRTLALLPQHAGAPARDAAAALAKALEPHGSVAVVDAETGRDKSIAWCNALEANAQFVLYVGDEGATPWRERCLRQADALVFVVDAKAEPAAWSESLCGVSEPLPRPAHIAVVHEGKPRLGAGRRWSRHFPKARLHHLRGPDDYGRMARLTIGKGMALVLSGGGARGFAHLGVVKALREAGVVVDCVGGTSIGAIIGAGVAADWDFEPMVEVFRRSFVTTNPLSDYTFPFVSMVSGRKVSRLLRVAFGEREIEDLPLPFFCVSSNLTSGQSAVHRTGPLWQWLRASVAIPGVLPPVFCQGQVYVDGGVMNNLPVDVMRDWQRGEIIASDIGGDHAMDAPIEEFDLPPLWQMVSQWFRGIRRPSVISVLLRAGMVNSGAQTLAARGASTLLIMPPLGGIDLLNWRAFDRAIEIGYQHTLRVVGHGGDALAAETPPL